MGIGSSGIPRRKFNVKIVIFGAKKIENFKIYNSKVWSSRVDVDCFSEHFDEILSSIGVVLSDFRYGFRYFCLRKYCKAGFRDVDLEVIEAVLEVVKVEILKKNRVGRWDGLEVIR